MKNLIAISAAALTAGTASAGVQLYTTLGDWQGNTFYATTQNVVDTLAYAVQTNATTVTGYGNGNGYAIWEQWTATTNGTALSLSGTYGSDQVMAATPANSNIVVTFTTSIADPQRGIMEAAIAYTVTGTVAGNITVSFDNGLSSSLSIPATANGFIGVVNENPVIGSSWAKIVSITFSTTGGGTLSIDTIYANYVPAPGAVALVGVAGLVGSRRRRA